MKKSQHCSINAILLLFHCYLHFFTFVFPIVIQKRNLRVKHKHSTIRACHKGVKINNSGELESAKSGSKHDSVRSSEVRKVRESLKSSSYDLRALVNDPLPDALHLSEVVRSKLATSDTNIEPPIENQSPDVDVPDPNVCRSIVLFQSNDANLGKKSSVHCSDMHQPNLMERNRTAHTLEVIMFLIVCFNLGADSFNVVLLASV